MKKNIFLILMIASLIVVSACRERAPRLIGDGDKIVAIEVLSRVDSVINRTTPGAEDNKFGFEGGRVIKIGDTYHLITAEIYDEPRWIAMRLGHWTSPDGVDWRRVGTIRQSDGDFTGTSQRSSVWGPMVVFNDDDNRWHLVYVCYKGKPDEPNIFWSNHDGVIQHAVSSVEGLEGIYGPYEDKGILMRYDDNPDPWEGLQGTDSFFPYKVGDNWYAFYGSATTQDLENCQWSIGLAQADRIEGPWKRMSHLNPVDLGGFAENPIVMQLENGVYIAIVDGGFEVGKPGYTLSWDGIHWSKLRYIDLESPAKKWWGMMRTPLSLIKESDGTYTLFFTAYQGYEYAEGFCFCPVSKASLKITFFNN